MDRSSKVLFIHGVNIMIIETEYFGGIKNLIADFFYPSQIRKIPQIFFVILFSILSIGLLLLFSAGGGFQPWCLRQAIHILIGFFLLIIISALPVSHYYTYAYAFYVISVICLFLTAFIGVTEMGAQRWIKILYFRFQPSELARISLILILAKYFFDNPLNQSFKIKKLLIPLLLVALPVILTLKQPDLGTAMLLFLGGGFLFFFAGVNIKFFVYTVISFSCSLPVFWSLLHDYQKNRMLTFLNPERDPLGSGYHIIQSKIAIGSGGFWGKGFLQGTQTNLDFLPEKQTDFIFTLLSEEFGFLGVVTLMTLYMFLIILNFLLVFQTRNLFQRLIIVGFTTSFALYVIINISMVVGFLPVVGIPLPLVSYGGTSIVTLLLGQGIIFSAAFCSSKAKEIDIVILKK